VANLARDNNDVYTEILTRWTLFKKGGAGAFFQQIGTMGVGVVWDWVENGLEDRIGFGSGGAVGANEAINGLPYEVNEGSTYWTRMRWSPSLGMAKVWNLVEDEPEGWMITSNGSYSRLSTVSRYNTDTCTLISDQINIGFQLHGLLKVNEVFNPEPELIGYSEVVVHAVFASRSEVLLPSSCYTDIAGPGVYYDTLTKDNGYWVPASPNVSDYVNIYFDGMAVTEGSDYWLDGLKVYPSDPATFEDTIATAEVVVR
jgi:hypothetical protein